MALPTDVTNKLSELTKSDCDALTVTQIKKVRSLIDQAIEKNSADLVRHAHERDEMMKEIANWVHPSVPVSNDEVGSCSTCMYVTIECPMQSMSFQDEDNRTERTSGDVEQRKKYSHVDLVHMIGGMDAERGTATSGGRGYYLMVRDLTVQVQNQLAKSSVISF